MQSRWMKFLLGSVALLLCVSLAISAEDGKSKGLRKTTTNDYYTWFTINNIFNWYGNNGDGSINNSTGQSGFEFPKGSGNTAIFEDGIIWGGFHKGRSDPKVGGSAYNQMLQAGVLTGYGTATTDPPADNPSLAKYRVYRVRPDVTPTTPYAAVQKAMEDEAALINRYNAISAQAVFNQYILDWNEWPAKDGLPAPYLDVNKNGVYDPTADVPGQPGADQTLYYVANDANATRTQAGYSSPPIGLEMHRTIWGYNLAGALGNTIFGSTLIINKSGAPVDSMFMVQFSDPDLGEAGDDYVGCDVARSLGFVYNGKTFDNVYGTAVPSSGYDFFQGPIVPTGNLADSAVFRLKYRKGYRNLGMSAWTFFTQGNATFADPLRGGDPAGDNEWYRLMNGRIAKTDGPFINPKTGQAQMFVFDGDPLSGKGWLDGTNGLVPGDRRMALITGPFTLANADTQEMVVATLVGLGGDRLSSVAVIKYYSDLGQSAYNALFNIARPPPSPKVTVTALDGEIVLSWADSVGSTKIESFSSGGYAFEGYNVYQFQGTTPDYATAKKLVTYDLVNSITTIFDDVYDPATGYVLNKPVQFGTDASIKRSYVTTQDALAQKALVNASTYYYGVTSYGFNSSPTVRPTQLESTPDILIVTPQSAVPGTAYNTTTGKSLTVTHTAGITTGQTYATVVDPRLVTGKNYEARIAVTDSVFNPDLGVNVANPKWRLYDVAASKALTPPSTDYNFSDANPIVEGVQFGISGAPFYVAGKELGSLTWTPGAFPFSGINDTPYPGDGFINSIFTADQVAQDVQMEFTAPGQGQNAYMFLRTATGGSGGAPYNGYYPQRFKVYELNPDGTRKRQIDFVFMEQVTSPTYNNIWWPGASSGNREYWFFVTETYSSTAKAKYAGSTLSGVLAQDSCVWSGWYTRAAADTAPTTGAVWTIKTTKIVTAADRWTFTTQGLAPTVGNANLAASEVERVNVFPNPYIGFNPQEVNKYQRFVTFTHLPRNATIRIFNLAGLPVRTLVKDDATQFLQWDLKNENSFPVAAGMYIVYIDMPGVGKTKILKLGVIPEQQYIDKW